MAKETTASAVANAISIDEAMLVEQAKTGDMGAFGRLVSKYQDRVLNVCWRMAGNMDDAQDLAQEAFLHALESIQSFQHKAGFYTWLYRIAVNLSITHRRKSARQVKLSLHGRDGQWGDDCQEVKPVGRVSNEKTDPAAKLSARETERLVMEGLEQLDEEQRAIIVLKDVESLDYQQIAEILEVPVGTVKSRLHRARMALRERLKPIVSLEE
ncbi:MAG: sigma-70 family RNA polymerase sigma factor [Planctomycetota bacterium]|nr:MAG: sigma-70 family RNA polymerase sigma factor [Planctomycetota bacterium]